MKFLQLFYCYRKLSHLYFGLPSGHRYRKGNFSEVLSCNRKRRT